MWDMMWIFAASILLLSEAWSHEPVVINSTFNIGSEVNLTCSNKTWNEIMFVTWTYVVNNQHCRIASNSEGGSVDNCKDGKSLRNTSTAQSYLHISNFSNDDVGVYKCESVFRGGLESYDIHVAITVPPKILAWLEHKDNKMVAVCRAERGKPAANISWSHGGNSSSKTIDSHGFYTVESRLELLKEMDRENLTCAIRHQSWKGEKILIPELPKGYVLWLCILVVVVIIVFLAGFLFFAQKKLTTSRQCQQSVISSSKSPPTEHVEEVEPYASYVQRVNSIYNSSADLFT
ncbi:cell surface glycoprotein CD200 receptor 1-A isoform X2 [Plectropomus leopardus]|uniref:cell surface glycoprotein CD200 receptor 1-A isoform X2 n=1 Tax=Plectropomus leopardus TaxID=160734 RepID=UPI001C4D00C3|nr:cell surface glycoprotein CD200 receptor 1-A isoform X2 [Plectropomus leopardus]